jgi:hypothetical protein
MVDLTIDLFSKKQKKFLEKGLTNNILYAIIKIQIKGGTK